jgi:hypothetical protein
VAPGLLRALVREPKIRDETTTATIKLPTVGWVVKDKDPDVTPSAVFNALPCTNVMAIIK